MTMTLTLNFIDYKDFMPTTYNYDSLSLSNDYELHLAHNVSFQRPSEVGFQLHYYSYLVPSYCRWLSSPCQHPRCEGCSAA